MTLHANAVATLRGWRAPSPRQEALRLAYLDHLARHADGVWRDGPPAHLTASCFVVDEAGEQILMSLHRKGGFWVQFGGHCEQGDRTLADTALREAREESGIEGVRLLPGPFDLDRHALSASFGRCREHLDVAWLAIAPLTAPHATSSESEDVRWWPIAALPPGVVADLPRRLTRVSTVLETSR